MGDRLRRKSQQPRIRGISRYGISQETGVEQSAPSRFVSGERGLDLSSVEKLAADLELEFVNRDQANWCERKGRIHSNPLNRRRR